MASGRALGQPAPIRHSLFASSQRKTPGSCLPGAVQRVSRSGSEVTLSADVERNGVLVLELVGGVRLRRHVGERRSAGELLVEPEVHDFRRERQVLDRSPASYNTNLIDVEVGVAGVVSRLGSGATGRCTVGVGVAVVGLDGVVVTD